MKKKVLIFNVAIIAASLIFAFISGIKITQNSQYQTAEREVIALTRAYSANYNDKVTENVPKNVRVTVIDSDFKVIADSEDGSIVGTMHDNREELTAAIIGEPKVVTRYSGTLNEDMVYYAEKVDTGSGFVLVRVAIPVESVKGYVFNTVGYMALTLIFALLAAFIASLLINANLLKPLEAIKNNLGAIADGKRADKPLVIKDKDLKEVYGEIDEIADKLQKTFTELKGEREKLDYVLSNVTDGIVVLEQSGDISVINAAAKEFLKIPDVTGKPYYTLSVDEEFISAIKAAVSERAARETGFSAFGRYYSVSVKPLDGGYTVVVLNDITSAKLAEKTRSEFFANASHELKTPLTAIKGFNEILSMTSSDEKAKELSEKIGAQVDRIVKLINDMLALSRLETEDKPADETVDLGEVLKSVKEELTPLADKNKVELSVTGGGKVKMNGRHAEELVKNLLENAVRYTDGGGYAKASVKKSGDKLILTVEDDGIGIADEDKERIFERFYRVDKSRSQKTGGTGLGLAIVKHICNLYGFKLTLTSKLGVGTKIVVELPA